MFVNLRRLLAQVRRSAFDVVLVFTIAIGIGSLIIIGTVGGNGQLTASADEVLGIAQIAPDLPVSDTSIAVEPDLVEPDLEVPDLEVPDLVEPDLEVPDLEAPDLVEPDLEVPDLVEPDLEVPDLVVPDLVELGLVVPDSVVHEAVVGEEPEEAQAVGQAPPEPAEPVEQEEPEEAQAVGQALPEPAEPVEQEEPEPTESVASEPASSETPEPVLPGIVVEETRVEQATGLTLAERGHALYERLGFDAGDLGYTISFHSANDRYRGLTFTRRHHIEVYIRQGDSDAQVTRVIAHELGHAVDHIRNNNEERQRWRAQRGMDPDMPWWPGSGAPDLATPAGDFAECFASWLAGSTPNSSWGDCRAAHSLVAELAAS